MRKSALNQFLPSSDSDDENDKITSNPEEQKVEKKENIRSTIINTGETVEHIDFGDSSFAKFLEDGQYLDFFSKMHEHGFFDLKDKRFIFNTNKVRLTYGEIMGMAGDYFADPKQPITVDLNSKEVIKSEQERERRFYLAYDSLTEDTKDAPDQVKDLLNMFWFERKRIEKKYEEQGGKMRKSELIKESSDELNYQSIKITSYKPNSFWDIRGKVKHIFPNALNNKYTDLLENNYDHFSPYAKLAYETGHNLAIKEATLARKYLKEENYVEAYRFLMRAITLEAFAGHYSTDSFSAGHMRVPRLELPKSTTIERHGHVLAHEQHDEDGKYGLWVTNKQRLQQFADYILKKSSTDECKQEASMPEDNVEQTETNKVHDLQQKLSYIDILLKKAQFVDQSDPGAVKILFKDYSVVQDLSSKLAELKIKSSLEVEDLNEKNTCIKLALDDYKAISNIFWKAYGDSSFFEPESHENRETLVQMVEAGLRDVFRAFQNEELKNDNQTYFPIVESPKLGRNHYAMFKLPVDTNVIEKRKNLGETKHLLNSNPPTSKAYDKKWLAKTAIDERDVNLAKEAWKLLRH